MIEHPVDPSSLVCTDMQLDISYLLDNDGRRFGTPTKAQRDLNTLNYLCMIKDENFVPQRNPFTWNWMDQNQQMDFHGVQSVNRNVFRDYIHDQIINYVKNICIHTSAWTDHSWDSTSYKATLTPGQDPTIVKSTSGEKVLEYTFSHSSEDDTSSVGLINYGKLNLESKTEVNVVFKDRTIIVTQSLGIYTAVRQQYSTVSGWIVRKTITDTYTLGVNEHGQLQVVQTSDTVDTSEDPNANGFIDFFTGGINGVKNSIKNSARNFAMVVLTSLPISIAQSFIFPGGRTFAFKDVEFSRFQDLTTKITYVDNFEK